MKQSNRSILMNMEIGDTFEWELKDADSVSATAAALKKHGYMYRRKTVENGYQITRIK